jgi:aldehyde:ferredoxin oxidoreductase
MTPDMSLGRTAFVDLSRGEVRVEPTPESLVRAFLGGRGLNMAYLHRLLPPGADPLGPENVLLFGTGLLTGYPVPNSSRMNITAKSPESLILGDANMGGFFPAQMKQSGFDRLVVTGCADRPVYLYLSEGRAEIRSAETYWGLDVPATQAALVDDLGSGVRSAVIGPAGEHLVRFACVMTGRKNAAGRGGMGAVMGSKMLKAVVAAGDLAPEVADREGTLALRKQYNEYLHASKVIEVLGAVGTPLLYENHNRLGVLRTKNSQANQWTDGLDAAHVEQHVRKMVSCAGCTVHCRHVNEFGGEGPDFATEGNVGSNLGVSDVTDVIKLNNLCNDLGLDTSSVGGVIGWAMELSQRGIISESLTEGPLAWGDVPRIRGLMADIAVRRGFGDVLADSTQAVPMGKLPAEAAGYLIAVKSLPQSDPHDVRYIKSFALGVAVASRGADHLRSRPTLDIMRLPEELLAKVYGVHVSNDPTSYETKEHMVAFSEDIFAVVDSLGICKFVCRGFNSPKLLGYDEFAALLRTAVGLQVTPAELREVGRRVVDLERVINNREGISRPDDTLPERFFDEPLPGGPSEGHHIDRDEFAALLGRYYDLRGWDEDGRVSVPRVDELAALTAAAAPSRRRNEKE